MPEVLNTFSQIFAEPQALAIFLPALLAVFGYIITHIFAVRRQLHDARVEFLNAQIRDLYGPLYAIDASNRAAWISFRAKYRPDISSYFKKENPPSEEETKAFVQWMRSVFHPNNKRMHDVITSNAHLIEGNDFPESFREFLIHVETYQVVIDQWDAGNFSEYTSRNNYPRDTFSSEVEDSFLKLKRRQKRLLRRWR
ncbi:MAG: hypothetical protein AAFR21_13670 [Pseudomonadota bacterium]